MQNPKYKIEEIDDLSGRKLDFAVGKYVLGFDYLETQQVKNTITNQYEPQVQWGYPTGYDFVPEYHKNMSDTWKLFENYKDFQPNLNFNGKEWFSSIIHPSKKNETICNPDRSWETKQKRIYAKGEKAEEVICKLLVKFHMEKHDELQNRIRW